jgi:hypothetical protein
VAYNNNIYKEEFKNIFNELDNSKTEEEKSHLIKDLRSTILSFLYFSEKIELERDSLIKENIKLKTEKRKSIIVSEEGIAKLIANSNQFSYEKNIIVRNVKWGWRLNYEADLIVVSKSRIASEIEIKISVKDLKNDFKKHIQHKDPYNRIRYMWYAGPAEMCAAFEEYCPEHTGILLVEWKDSLNNWILKTHRRPKTIYGWNKMSKEDYFKLARLGAMRYWSRS